MLGNMLNDLAKAIRRWTEKKEFFPSVQCLRGFRQVVTQAFTCRKLNWNACKAISKRRLQKRAGEDLYIVHNAIPLTRASTNQQENKQNKNHKKQNTQKTTKQTKQHKKTGQKESNVLLRWIPIAACVPSFAQAIIHLDACKWQLLCHVNAGP